VGEPPAESDELDGIVIIDQHLTEICPAAVLSDPRLAVNPGGNTGTEFLIMGNIPDGSLPRGLMTIDRAPLRLLSLTHPTATSHRHALSVRSCWRGTRSGGWHCQPPCQRSIVHTSPYASSSAPCARRDTRL
jgi:hypothetical protein